ncbi:hypothetical protein [Citreimonas salinaria]|nr:hypothetical protein [Citreimonas salinaria]
MGKPEEHEVIVIRISKPLLKLYLVLATFSVLIISLAAFQSWMSGE